LVIRALLAMHDPIGQRMAGIARRTRSGGVPVLADTLSFRIGWPLIRS